MVDRISEQYSQSSDQVENECSAQKHRHSFKHMYLMGPISFSLRQFLETRLDAEIRDLIFTVTECKFSFTRSAKCICNIIQVHTSLKINDIQVIFVFYRLTLISVWYRKKRKHLILEQSSPRINKFVQDIKVGIEVKLMQNSIVLCFFNFFESFFFFQVTF